jgi:hypothetical protein
MDIRWEGDERGHGVGDALGLVPGAEELVTAMSAPSWVAEQPEVHLLPHLARELRAVRAAVFALVGHVAETATYVRQRRSEDGLSFEVVTGMLSTDGSFAPHGHSLVLKVRNVLE